MIGIVVVSHSRPLADAAAALAKQMVPADEPKVAVAAGMDDGSLGTDAATIALAIASMCLMAAGLISWVYFHHRWPDIGRHSSKF